MIKCLMPLRLSRPMLFLALASSALAARAADPIVLVVDATRAPMRTIHTTETIPVRPGAMTLQYAKWIPGEHMPSGPIQDLVGLHVFAGDKEIGWTRDKVDMYGFRVEVPGGTSSLRVEFDYVMPTSGGAFGSAVSSNEKLGVVNWYKHALYPQGANLGTLQVKAGLLVPPGWQAGGSLAVERSSSSRGVEYAPTSVALLFDHPVVLGEHYRRIDLFPATDPMGEHAIDVIADSDWALRFPEKRIEDYRNLVREERAVFGGVGHYARYHWLLTLSDSLGTFGVEHHECADDRVGESTFVDDDAARQAAVLLPHEYFHSWNGKYRRPEGLVNGGFDKPMTDEGLWVYEGLTNYYGEVLAARCGLWSEQNYLDSLAFDALFVSNPGRTWRPLQDTATSSPFLYVASGAWSGSRRGTDFYAEGSLIWLEADTKIRALTNGARSLDDFCRRFHGQGENGKIALKPYALGEVYATLNEVAPFDWKGFFETRLNAKGASPPLGGAEAGGYRLVYTDVPNTLFGLGADGSANLLASLGLSLAADGTVNDAWPGTAAYAAGVAPGMKVVAVDGRKYSSAIVTKAIAAAKDGKEPIELLIDNGGFFKTVRVDYHGGVRYPHFERIEGKDDVIAKIVAARTKGQVP